MTAVRDQVYTDLEGLHRSFSSAADGLDAPLSEEVRGWLDTLDALTTQPPDSSPEKVTNALQRMEGFRDFLKRPYGESTVYEQIRDALVSRNPDNADEVIGDLEHQLYIANSQFNLGLSDDYIEKPQSETAPVVEPDGDTAPFSYAEMLADYMEAFRKGTDLGGEEKSHVLAQLIAFAKHASDYDEGRTPASISTIQQDTEVIENTEVFKKVVAGLDDEGYKKAARDPNKFAVMLMDLEKGIEPDEESEGESAPEENLTEMDVFSYPVKYRTLQEYYANQDTSGMSPEEKRSNLSLVLLANLCVRQGRGGKLVDMNEFLKGAEQVRKSKSFQFFTKDMNEEELDYAKDHPGLYLQLMAAYELDSEKAQQALEKGQEPQAEPVPDDYVPPVPGNVPGPVPDMQVKDKAVQEEPNAEAQQEVQPAEQQEEPAADEDLASGYEIVDGFEDGEVHSAEEWLEKARKEAADKQKSGQLDDAAAADLATQVLAIRMLAGAKRHDSGSLDKQLSETDIKAAKENLMANGHYRQFYSNLSGNVLQHETLRSDVKKHCKGATAAA